MKKREGGGGGGGGGGEGLLHPSCVFLSHTAQRWLCVCVCVCVCCRGGNTHTHGHTHTHTDTLAGIKLLYGPGRRENKTVTKCSTKIQPKGIVYCVCVCVCV